MLGLGLMGIVLGFGKAAYRIMILLLLMFPPPVFIPFGLMPT